MSLTAAGVGSGLDIENILSQLMEVERIPLTKLQQKESTLNAQLSAYGQLKSAVSTFQTAMESLKSVEDFEVFSATSSDEEVLTAEADSDAVGGTFDVEVTRLAQHHKMGSDEFADTDTFGGTAGDSLTLTVGTDSMTVDLSSGMTLDEIRDAINSDEDNPGVTATVLNTGTGTQRLILTADESGYEDRVQLSYGGTITDTTFNLASTNRDSDGNLLADLADLDAAYTIDGFDLTSSSNSPSDAIDGITLNLAAIGSSTVTVERDTEAVTESVQEFVDAYNGLIGTIDSLRDGQLSGDMTLNGLESQLRGVLNTSTTGLSSVFSALSQVGITTNSTSGELELDTTDLEDALDADFEGVAKLFGDADDGYAARFYDLADDLLDIEGILKIREDGLNDRIDDNQDRQAMLERRLTLKEASLRSQYAALDGLIGSMQSTSEFLTQRLSSSSNS